MLRGLPALLLVAALSGAPVQCGSEPDPSNAMEETPGEALYELAEKFRKNGDSDAWRDTLLHLIERYPGSRFAVAAKQDLADAGIETPAEPEAPRGAQPTRAAASP
jgi:TolA-binding protein